MKEHIAIDGPAGAGKSTVARKLAERLGYLYIDTGAMYRAVTYALLRDQVSYTEPGSLDQALKKINLQLTLSERLPMLFLDGQRLTWELRDPLVDQHVSPVAQLPPVRLYLRKRQRDLALSQRSVTEGRDIGTVIISEADLKIFLTARPDIRAHRRWLELKEKGRTMEYTDVLMNILERDSIDSSRTDAPLKQAPDAIVVDTSDLGMEEVVESLYQMASRVPLA
ncbi:MAG: (d)CMP kinase [Candidatus Atribacteria bacterium]|nr:(d)CMP kinase [Candidatus Atribacteria bacterium]